MIADSADAERILERARCLSEPYGTEIAIERQDDTYRGRMVIA